MENFQTFSRGEVVFREGDAGDCMYELESGGVGVYHDYGGPKEKLISTLFNTSRELKLFGEMGLLEHAPRSATVVALENDTILMRITEADFESFFTKNPSMLLDMMQQMCNRLRRTTQDYVEACHTAYDTVETEKIGADKDRGLLDRIDQLCAFYTNYQPIF